ncbi:MAG: DNA mismatch repair protein MutS [Christensenellales bacterium]
MAISKMMAHYLEVKEKYKDCIIFYRLGDFYEMFFEDAELMSKELDLTLTGRDCGLEKRAPMCGIPVKAVDIYIAKALELGYKLAICEQLTEPKPGQIVERDVIRVITPGTVMESEILDQNKNNFLASLYASKNGYGLSWCDISTGEMYATEFDKDASYDKINDILTMISPAEIICNSEAKLLEESFNMLERKSLPKFTCYFDASFEKSKATEQLKKQFGCISLKPFDLQDKTSSVCACGGLVAYLLDTQKRSLTHINSVKYISYSNNMHLDYVTRKNLEITSNSRDGGTYGTILWYLNKTSTSMGTRLLRKFVEEPLQDIKEIKLRQDGVEELYKNIIKRESIIELLSQIKDLERLCGRISYNSLKPCDCNSIEKSLKVLPQIKELLKTTNSKVLIYIQQNIDEHIDVCELLNSAIIEDAPTNTKDGGFIKQGYSEELDELRLASTEGRNWITQLQNQEIAETNIKGLKIKYNHIFGYYIEVPNSQKELIPFRYQRKQTLANCERYVTTELMEIEQKILGSEERALKLEQKLFAELREKLLEYLPSLKTTASFIAYLDVLTSLATVAVKNNLVKPNIVDKSEALQIIDGRHPIVEVISKDGFVPNDTLLDKQDNRTMIITSPNMAGKSTYMRQVAVITLMAHIGSFVPAKSAQIPITDRIFTRIGATDDLAYGQSTFMVEMTEVANILRNATPDSLILLDEIGRGTSTFDGLSIAWAVMDYISQNLVSKTLFSTHYHELTELEGNLKGVKNYRINVREFDGSIIFLRKIVRGGANRSFGIEVAKLAGLPQNVISRAKEILKSLEQADVNNKVLAESEKSNTQSVASKRNEREVINILQDVSIDKMTPFEAMSLIHDLKEKLKD